MVFAVGENHDGASLGMLFGAESLTGRVKGGPEVCSSRSDPAGPQPMQRIEHGAQVFGQRATEHPPAGERHHGRAVGRFARQGVHQALGRLDRRGQAIGYRVFDPHAPADVDHQHHVMARRNRRRGQPPPARLCHGDNQTGNTRNQENRAVTRHATSLRQRLPAPRSPAPPPDRPEDQARQDQENPQQFRMSKSHRDNRPPTQLDLYPLTDSWKQRPEALEHLGNDVFRDWTDPRRFARPPVQALHLVRPHHARNGRSSR